MWEFIRFALLFILVGLLVTAAIGDVRRYTIPNWLCLAVALLALPYLYSTFVTSGVALWPALGLQAGMAALVFVLFAALFAAGVMGGGDVKLMAALALWMPGRQVFDLMLLVAMFGGLVALGVLVGRRLRKHDGENAVPYGVAIAAGGIALTIQPIVNVFGG